MLVSPIILNADIIGQVQVYTQCDINKWAPMPSWTIGRSVGWSLKCDLTIHYRFIFSWVRTNKLHTYPHLPWSPAQRWDGLGAITATSGVQISACQSGGLRPFNSIATQCTLPLSSWPVQV